MWSLERESFNWNGSLGESMMHTHTFRQIPKAAFGAAAASVEEKKNVIITIVNGKWYFVQFLLLLFGGKIMQANYTIFCSVETEE